MRFVRNRAGLLAAVVLTFQLGTLAAAYAVISCDQGHALERARPLEAASAGHAGMSGHEGMADCPMQKNQPACPLHAEKHGTNECDCPTVGCSQPDAGFMALFGAVGILSTGTTVNVPLVAGDTASVISPSVNHLAAVPLSPPPRA